MDVANYKELQAQRDLQACGLTEESINAIRSTTVVNHNGEQKVIPTSQMGSYTQSVQNQQASIHVEDATGEISSSILTALQTQLHDQQRMFSRYKQFSDQRISSLERQLAQALETIKSLSNKIQTVSSNQQARTAQDASPGKVAGSIQRETSQKAPSDQPIDRNGVSPESVQIDKIFYYGNR